MRLTRKMVNECANKIDNLQHVIDSKSSAPEEAYKIFWDIAHDLAFYRAEEIYNCEAENSSINDYVEEMITGCFYFEQSYGGFRRQLYKRFPEVEDTYFDIVD